MELRDQIIVELCHQGQPVACAGRHFQLVQGESEQLSEFEMSIENEGRVHGGLHGAHELSEQCRLSGTCFARNDDKALAGLDTIAEGSECLPIKRVCIGKPRIGRDAKRELYQSKMFAVHNVHFYQSVSCWGFARCIAREQKNVLVNITRMPSTEELLLRIFAPVSLGLGQHPPRFAIVKSRISPQRNRVLLRCEPAGCLISFQPSLSCDVVGKLTIT